MFVINFFLVKKGIFLSGSYFKGLISYILNWIYWKKCGYFQAIFKGQNPITYRIEFLEKTRGYFKVIRVTSKTLIINPDNPVKTRRANNPGFWGSKYLNNPDKTWLFYRRNLPRFFQGFQGFLYPTLITLIKPGFF